MNEYIIELPELGEITVDFETGPEITIEMTGVPGREGDPGEPGQDGVSPTVTVTDITGGHRVTITDAEHPQGISFDVMNGQDGQGAVQDVQVNGTSVLNDGVADILRATSDRLGVVKPSNGVSGIYITSDGTLYCAKAEDSQLKSSNNLYRPVVPSNHHTSVFYALAKAAGDTTQSASSNTVGTYTESAKSKISEMLSSPVTVSGTTPTITALSGIQYVCGEVATLDITLPASGIVDVVFESGSTPTVLTITPPTGVTVKWANGFDPTSLEANTTYEINIKDGLGVAVGWT